MEKGGTSGSRPSGGTRLSGVHRELPVAGLGARRLGVVTSVVAVERALPVELGVVLRQSCRGQHQRVSKVAAGTVDDERTIVRGLDFAGTLAVVIRQDLKRGGSAAGVQPDGCLGDVRPDAAVP